MGKSRTLREETRAAPSAKPYPNSGKARSGSFSLHLHPPTTAPSSKPSAA